MTAAEIRGCPHVVTPIDYDGGRGVLVVLVLAAADLVELRRKRNFLAALFAASTHPANYIVLDRGT